MEQVPGFPAEPEAQEDAGQERRRFGISPTGSVTGTG